MRFKTLQLPLELFKQKDFAVKIEKINENVYQHTLYLKSIIEKQHEVYLNSFKETSKQINTFQRVLQRKQSFLSNSQKIISISKYCPIVKNIQQLLKGLSSINQGIETQLTKNIIFMNSRKNSGLKKGKNLLKEKLVNIDKQITDYIAIVREYNYYGTKYIKKAQYFKEIDKQPIKYYSITKNDKKYDKIVILQDSLSKKLEQIENSKNQIKIKTIQLSIKISEFYEGMRISIEQYRKIENSIRERTKIPKMKQQFISIKQVSQSEQFTQGMSIKQSLNQQKRFSAHDIFSDSQNISTNSIRTHLKKSKKQKTTYLQHILQIQKNLSQFFNAYVQKIYECYNQIHIYQKTKQYKKFTQDKLIMSEILSPRCIQDIDLIIFQFNNFQHTFDRVTLTLNQKIFQQIFKFKVYIIKRYIKQISQLKDSHKNIAEDECCKRFKEIQDKYAQAEQKSNEQFREKIHQLIQRIQSQFQNTTSNQVPRVSKKIDLFSKSYFQILKLPYFSQNKKLTKFQRSDIMVMYEKLLEGQKKNRDICDFQEQNIDHIKNSHDSRKRATSCCGLVRKTPKNRKNKSLKIDSFSCAIKDGYLFLHGTLYIYEKFLRFKSSFNPETFFGEMDLCVAYEDIREIVEGKHLMSLLVSIITKIGPIQFTNFLSNPLKVLSNTYKKASQNKLVQIKISNIQCFSQSQLLRLKRKFQQDFIQRIQLANLKITRYNSYIIDSTLALQYNYELKDQKQSAERTKKILTPYTFKAKITKYENQNRLQYFFWHSEHLKNVNIKTTLESLSKKLISEDCQKRIQQQIEKQKKQQSESQRRLSFDISANNEGIPSIGEFGQNENQISKIQKRKSTISVDLPQMRNRSFMQLPKPNTPEFSVISPIKVNRNNQLQQEDQQQGSVNNENFSEATTIKYNPHHRNIKYSIPPHLSKKTRRKLSFTSEVTSQKQKIKQQDSQKVLKFLALLALIMTFINVVF